MNGEIPYRDFLLPYPPGIIYLVAFGFKLIGVNLKTLAFISVFIFSLISTITYIAIKKNLSFTYAFLGFLLSLIWLKRYMVLLKASYTAILFSIIGSIFLLIYIRKKKIIWIFIVGMINGLVTLFRQDFGVYTLIATVLSVLAESRKENKNNYKVIFKAIFYLILGISVVILPIIIYFLWKEAVVDMFYSITVPVFIFLRFRRLPFPFSLSSIGLYFPLFILMLTGFNILYYKRLRNEVKDKTIFVLFYLFLGIGTYYYASIRPDFEHLIPSRILSVILFIFILEEYLSRIPLDSMLGRVFKKTIFIFIFSYIFNFIYLKIENIYTRHQYLKKNIRKVIVDLDRAKGFYNYPTFSRAQILTIKYIQKLTKYNEKIFVGSARHDKIYCNDIMFYFLSERNSATKYFVFDPGFTNTYPVQNKIIEELKNNQVNYIVLVELLPTREEEFYESNRGQGATILDEFIHENYVTIKTIDNYMILKKKDRLLIGIDS